MCGRLHIIILLTFILSNIYAQQRLYNISIASPEQDGYTNVNIVNNKLFCTGLRAISSSHQNLMFDVRDFNSTLISHNIPITDTSLFSAPRASQPLLINGQLYLSSWHQESPSAVISPYFLNIDAVGDTLKYLNYNFNKKTVTSAGSVDFDSNLVFCGLIEDSLGAFVDDDVFVIKMDTTGSVIWTQSFGGYLNDWGSTIVTTRDSGYIVSGLGTYSPQIEADPLLVKLNKNGIVEWQIHNAETAERDYLHITKYTDSTFIRFGTIDSNTVSDENSRFQLIDEYGNVIWDTVYVFSDDLDSVEDLFVIDNEIVFMGPLISNSIGYTHIGKLNSAGELLWHRRFGARSTGNFIFDIEILPDGDIIGAGYLDSDPQHPSQDAWLLRLNCLGYDTLPRAMFNYQLDSTLYTTDSIQFNNLSLRADNYIWEFGDGQSYQHSSNPAMLAPSIPNVKHVYTMPGTYIVKLHAIACQDTTTFSDTLFVEERPKLEGFYVYPNPTQNGVYIRNSALDANSTYTLSIYSIDGRIAYSKNVSGGELINEYYLDTPGWASGVYNGVISAGDERHNFRFVIARE